MKEIGENYAILVDPLNLESIADGIAKLRDETTREWYVKKSKQRVKNYSWEKTYRCVKKVFFDVLNTRL